MDKPELPMFCSIAVTTGDVRIDTEDEMKVGGCLMIDNPYFAHVIVAILSIEMLDNVIEGLQEARKSMTFSQEVVTKIGTNMEHPSVH